MRALQKHKFKIWQGKDGKWRTYIETDDGRKMIVRKSREKLVEYLAGVYRIEDDVSMADLCDDWLEYKGLHVAAPTVRRLTYSWLRFYDGDPLTLTPIKEITRMDLDIWIHSKIKDNNLNKKAYNNFIGVLNGIMDYAVQLGIIDHNLKRDIKIGRVLKPTEKPADCTQVYNAEELERLIALCMDDFKSETYYKNILVPLAVIFCFFSGLRISEVVVVKYEDISGSVLEVRRMYRDMYKEIIEQPKGSYGARRVPLIDDALDIVDLCRQTQDRKGIDTEYMFSMTESPAPYDTIRKAYYKYCKKLGIRPKSSHKARKTFISSLISEGMNINSVRQIAGHKDEKTTFNNYCFDRSSDRERREKMEKALQNPSKKNRDLSTPEPKISKTEGENEQKKAEKSES